MSVNPKDRRKVYRKKEKQFPKSKITKKDKIYGVLALIAVVISGFLLFWFVLKDLFHK